MIFVTGGTGLVGAHLLFELVKTGKPVMALKRPASNLHQTLKIFSYYHNQPEELFNKINWVDGDILDYFPLEKLLSGVEEVYHCAAIVSFLSSERQKMVSNNVKGTANIVNASLQNGVKKFCHVSSVAALGRNLDNTPVTEDTSWVPSKKNSGYSESKFYSEAEVWRGIHEGLNSVIVNPSIILGPGNWDNGSPKLFKAIDSGLKFYTKGVTGYVDIADVVKAMVLLTDSNNFETAKNQRYLLNAENWSYQDLFYAIANELGKKRPSVYASNAMLGIAWRLAAAGNIFSHRPSSITKETVSNSNCKFYFDGNKIKSAIAGFQYKSIADSIKETSRLFLAGKQKKQA